MTRLKSVVLAAELTLASGALFGSEAYAKPPENSDADPDAFDRFDPMAEHAHGLALAMEIGITPEAWGPGVNASLGDGPCLL